jgi:creatinine amidohydrolase/Fe(II)-dependent formamide hydrolase-like protein
VSVIARLASCVAPCVAAFVGALGAALLMPAVALAAPASVFLDDYTWPELREAQHAGKTTIIIPVGGTEQSGPALALGKHNVRVRILAGRIAEALGNAIVAPVVSYVPEGSISPPAGHMRFPGTISIPDAAFQGLLEGAARSFKQGGFADIVLIGDHGGYQTQLKAVAQRLNKEWAATPTRAHFIDEYYRVTQTAFVQAMRAKGLTPAQIGEHAGSADTSLMLATDPALVRQEAYDKAAREAPGNGVNGDPRAASLALGQAGVELIVSHSVAAIRQATAARQ